jgi:secondary thiamine-phosphate synthase enzyme
MITFFDEIKVSTTKPIEFIDITDDVTSIIKNSKVSTGYAIIFSQHTTGAIRISEFESSLMTDLAAFFEKLAPESGNYLHNTTNVDNRRNAHSHLQSILLNSSETVPIKDGKLMLGKWQKIFFIEVDGSRTERKITIEVVGNER